MPAGHTPSSSPARPGRRRTALALVGLAGSAALVAGTTGPAAALTSVDSGGGLVWQVHDAAPPGLDTGSLRAVSDSPVQGFGNLKVKVAGYPAPRLNGEMVRGFGLTYDGADTFETTAAVDLGGVRVTREVTVSDTTRASRFFDTFTNTTRSPLKVAVSFGGQLGWGTGADAGVLRSTSSGDAVIGADDAWTVAATSDVRDRPVGVVLGTPAPFAGGITGVGDQQRDPFTVPRATTGHAATSYGYLQDLTIEPGETESLLRYVHVGAVGATAAAASAVDALADAPDLSGLSPAEVCTVENWDLALLPGLDEAACAARTRLDLPAAPASPEPVTSAAYDVVGKTITQLQADLESGRTTSQEITRAYLDRIAVYDTGQLGFHAFITVADDAMEQA